MTKFIKKLSIFIIPILIYTLFATFILPSLLRKRFGPSTKEQIIYSFENAERFNYELLILGNSRVYRGINPDVFTIKSYNFSHDDDTYNQLYYKLIYLKNKNKKIKYLILGIDYFQFNFLSDKRNYVYGPILGDDYLKDYNSSSFSYIFHNYLNSIDPKKLRELNSDRSKASIKENGQFIKPGIAKDDDFIERDISRLEVQVNYFEKILNFCEEQRIMVFLVMLPLRKNELKNYSDVQLSEFNFFLTKYLNDSTIKLDYSNDNKYGLSDFSDITHLNAEAADRFSKQVNDTIISIISSRQRAAGVLD